MGPKKRNRSLKGGGKSMKSLSGRVHPLGGSKEDRVKMYSALHLFAEIHVFTEGAWHETHRWNYGLQQHLICEELGDSTASDDWSKPSLSTLSVAAIRRLRDQLRPEFVLLDVDSTLTAIVDAVIGRFVECGVIDAENTERAKHALLAHLRSQKCVCEYYGDDEDDVLRADADEEAMQILVDEFELVTTNVVCVVRLSRGEIAGASTGFEERTGTKELGARFVSFVFGSGRLRDASLIKASDEGNRTKDCFGKLPSEVRVGLELGSALALVFQDDTVVQAAYEAEKPDEVVAAVDGCLNDLHVVPRMTCPTHKGVRNRAKRMLQQMSQLTQQDKWLSKQDEIFENSLSVDGIVLWMQKFAVPLLLGITLALILANTNQRAYDKWAGASHHSSHGESHDSNSTNSSSYHHDDDAHDDDDDKEPHPTIFDLRIHGHDLTLHFIVNDVFMCLFFGLAAKEIVEAFQAGGSLHPLRLAVNPLAATVGGCVFPVLTYVALVAAFYYAGLLNRSEYGLGTYMNGWGIPTATDISIAWVTALCVFGPGHPAINFLLLLAVVDDGLGLIIIALAYPSPDNPLRVEYLGLVVLAMCIAYILRQLNCVKWSPYIFVAGPVAWFGLLYAALHPSLALVFVVPFIPLSLETNELPTIEEFLEGPLQAGSGGASTGDGHSPLHEFEEANKNFVDFFVLFAFGAVNAGVQLDETGALSLIVVLALFIGKAVGITAASSLAVKFGYPLPQGMGFGDLFLVGCISSVGLTVSLFISGEAFQEHPRLKAQAKMGALLSLASSLVLIAVSNSPLWPLLKPNQLIPGGASAMSLGEFRRRSTMIEEQALGEMVAANMKEQMRKIQQLEHNIEIAAKISRHDHKKVLECPHNSERQKMIDDLRNSHTKSSSPGDGASPGPSPPKPTSLPPLSAHTKAPNNR